MTFAILIYFGFLLFVIGLPASLVLLFLNGRRNKPSFEKSALNVIGGVVLFFSGIIVLWSLGLILR